MGLFTRESDGSVFDALMEWVDALRREGRYPYGLEELIGAIEGTTQDIADTEIEAVVGRKLAFWHELVVAGDASTEAINAFSANAYEMLRLLSSWRGENRQSLLPAIEAVGFSPPPDWKPAADNEDLHNELRVLAGQMISYIDFSGETSESIGRVVEIVHSIRSGTSESPSLLFAMQGLIDDSGESDSPPDRARKAAWKPEQDSVRDRLIANARSTWLIEMRYCEPKMAASRIGFSLWAITSALESIPGVAVRIEDWSKGSLIAKLRVYIANVWARDEVREVLGKGRDAVVGHYLDRPAEEAKKIRAEREKLEEEKKALSRKAEQQASPSEKEASELKLELLRGEVHAQKLDNSLKAIELIEKASSLVRDGIISADKVDIDINKISYFLFNGEDIDPGEPIRLIEKNEDIVGGDDVHTGSSED